MSGSTRSCGIWERRSNAWRSEEQVVKKLLLLALVAAVVYGTWKWLQQVQQNAASNQGRLKSPSEKALKEEK